MLLPDSVSMPDARLRQAAAAADDAAVGQRVGLVENQRGASLRMTLGLARNSPLPPLPTCSVPAETVVVPL